MSEHLGAALAVPLRVSLAAGVLAAAATLPRLDPPDGAAARHRHGQVAHLLTGLLVGVLPVGVLLAVLPFFNGLSPSLLLIGVAALAAAYRLAVAVADAGARLAYGVGGDAAHAAVAPALRPLVHAHLVCTLLAVPAGLWWAGLL